MSEEDESTIKKTYDFYLVLNLKTEDVRVRKTRTQDQGCHEDLEGKTSGHDLRQVLSFFRRIG